MVGKVRVVRLGRHFSMGTTLRSSVSNMCTFGGAPEANTQGPLRATLALAALMIFGVLKS